MTWQGPQEVGPPGGPQLALMGPSKGQPMHQHVGRHCVHAHCLAVKQTIAFASYLPLQAICLCSEQAIASEALLESFAALCMLLALHEILERIFSVSVSEGNRCFTLTCSVLQLAQFGSAQQRAVTHSLTIC